jgi:hypothetical protein
MNREQALQRRIKTLTRLFIIDLVLSGIWHRSSVALPKMGV